MADGRDFEKSPYLSNGWPIDMKFGKVKNLDPTNHISNFELLKIQDAKRPSLTRRRTSTPQR